MAKKGNTFALLLDEEGDDVTTLIANVAAKVASLPSVETKQQSQQKNVQSGSASASSVAVRMERGRGSGLGRGQFRNANANGNQRNFGDSNGFAVDDGGRGRGRGGRGRGRGGFNENRGGQRDFGGRGSQAQSGGDGWVEVGDSHGRPFRKENREFRNDNRNGGAERRPYYGERDGGRYSRVEGQNGFHKKEEEKFNSKEQTGSNGNTTNNGERDAPENSEVPKEAEQGKSGQVVSQDTTNKKSAEKEEDKVMTLDEYEKVLCEKRKALEALKAEERKVTLDKDLELMQLIEKKKEEELFIKLKSDKDKLKKKDIDEKEEKVRKSLNITEFLATAGRGCRRGRGRDEFRGRQVSEAAGAPAPAIGDPLHFPDLGGAAVKA